MFTMNNIKDTCDRINELKLIKTRCSKELISIYISDIIRYINELKYSKKNYLALVSILSRTFNTRDIEILLGRSDWNEQI